MEIIIGREPEDLQTTEEMGGIEELEGIVRMAVEITGPLYDVENSEVSVTLTDDEHIHRLNFAYRGLDRPTDVLSFAFVDSEEPEIEDGPELEVLGDIIISLERAWAQAQEYGHSMERELSFLAVHGMLHLLGYDHIDEEARMEMEEEQRYIMGKLGISRDGRGMVLPLAQEAQITIDRGRSGPVKPEMKLAIKTEIKSEGKPEVRSESEIELEAKEAREEHKEYKEYKEYKMLEEYEAHKAYKVHEEHEEYKEHNGHKGHEIHEANKEHKSGFVAVIGRPNVGKSTLINSLIGQKIAIMSDKPQTTRTRIMCVLTQQDAQMVFLDTPGIHKPKHKLGEYMVKAAEGTLKEVDAIIFVVDAMEKFGPGEQYILERLQATDKPVILAVNKLDLLEDRDLLLPIITGYNARYDFAATVPISAKEENNLDALLAEIKKYLPRGPQYYPEDMVTDQPERLIVAELIREKVLLHTREEIPHAIAVDIEEMKERDNGDMYVRATIYVERESQKGIVIGKRGALLKEIGAQSRGDIQMLLGCKVFLDLWVKVKKDWRNRDSILKEFGFQN